MKKCLTASLFKYPLAVVAGSILMKKYETVMRRPPYKVQISEERVLLSALRLFDVFVLLFGLALWQQGWL